MKKTGSSGFLLLLTLFSYSQETIQVDTSVRSKNNIFSFGGGMQHGFIFAHSPAVENTRGSNPTGWELMFSWQRNDKRTWDLCNCYPRKGLLLAYYDYDNTILGKGVLSSFFLEPSYRLGKGLFYSIKGAAGLAYLGNPYHPVRNPNNRSYSNKVSAHLLVGTGIWIRLHDQLWMNVSANYQHISNGGMREPNKGINWPTAGFALSYLPRSETYFVSRRSNIKFWKNQPARVDIGILGMGLRSTDEHDESKRVPLVGLQAQVSKQVGRINSLVAGIEADRDRSLYLKLKRDSIDVSATRVSLLTGHEFLLGKFLFSQRLGLYMFNQAPYFDRWYHSWGLSYRFSPHWGTGMNLKVHGIVAEHVTLRLIYSFSK